MTCPYCGQEMQTGVIQCRDGVAWRRKKAAVAALASVGASVTLAPAGGVLSGAAVTAWNCGNCKKIVIDYSEIPMY